MIDKISSFTSQYSFLSNDHICLVHYEGLLYASVTHAFQAARCQSPELRESISKMHDIEPMFSLVEEIDDPANWSQIRVRIMEILIRDKFRRNHILRQRLIETGSSIIQNSYEDNSNPSNSFWGTVNERGENVVGKILMKIRTDIEKDIELENWILLTFDLITDITEMPRIILHEIKRDERIRRIYLEDKRFYTVGTALDCDLKFTHSSIEAYHAVLLFDRGLGLVIIDLNSTSGTYINLLRLRKSIPAPVEVDDYITFAEKRKKYKVEIYVEHVRREYERRIRDIDRELKLLDDMQNPQKNVEELKSGLGMNKVRKVRVENIPRKMCSDEEVKELFKSLGSIEDVWVCGRRFEAQVKFTDQKAADSAVKWDGMMVQGRRIKIKYDRERSRSR